MITNAEIDEGWYKNNNRQTGGGYMCECEELYSRSKAAWYVTKYLAKSLDEQGWPKSLQRIRTSVGFPKLDPVGNFPQNLSWQKVPFRSSLGSVVSHLNNMGFRVELLDTAH
jgi:hypothetical protein